MTAISVPGSSRCCPIKNASSPRVDSSAQCASSTSTITGPDSASRPSNVSISSNSRARAWPASRASSGSPSSGTSRASSGMPRPGIIAVTASAPSSRTRPRRTVANGVNGSSSPPSRQPPVSTRASGTVAANSASSRDFPAPASPPISSAGCPPSRALASASARAAISSARPTRTGPDPRPATTPACQHADHDRPAGKHRRSGRSLKNWDLRFSISAARSRSSA